MILKALAKLLARPAVANWIIQRAACTPDEHLPGYMRRYWLFNRYDRKTRRPRWSFIPFSIRVHHILRADEARDHHDHPWNARTFILKGAYDERRGDGCARFRPSGDTAAIKFGEFHSIIWVSPGGVWTLFVMGKYRGVWGFDVDGKKVDFKTYLGDDEFSARRGPQR